MNRPSAEVALPERRAARRNFDRAASRFEEACFVHDETRRRLLERLEYVRIDPRVAVDLGCATGRGALALAGRYERARVVAVDSSMSMARRAAELAHEPRISVVAGDAEALPLADRSADLILANLLLPWSRPPLVFAEVARVLAEGGLLLMATLGPDSLQEIRRAWARVDREVHVHAAFDMHDLGDLALAAGLADPVMDTDRIEVTYADLRSAVRDLRACGAINVAGGRRRALTGPRRWRAFEERLAEQAAGDRLRITVELVLGQAWGRGQPVRKRPSGPSEVAVAVERIGRRS
jgi:malonyl-CoA O-methyltransferase